MMELFVLPCLALLLTITIGTFMAVVHRFGTAQIVIRQLAMVTSQNLPLATGLQMAGQGEPGKPGEILRRLAALLSAGLPLGDALKRGYPNCSATIRSLVEVGERTGCLASALRLIDADLARQQRARQNSRPGGSDWIVYPLLIMVIAAVIATGFMVVVVPKYKNIFSDFDAPMPGLTLLVINVFDTLFSRPMGPILFAAMLAAPTLAIYWAVRPRRFDRPYLSSLIADNIRWAIPGLRRIELATSLSTTASVMRLAAQAGMSLDRAAQLAAETDMNQVVRDRVREFASLLTEGVPPADAATRAGLGEVFASALRAARFGEPLDGPLGFLEDYYRAISSRLWCALRGLWFPIMTVCMGLVIGTFVVSMFLPLVTLINAVMGQV
ncbi:MAG: type II secretion system F family protein [Phycisphaerae bacterium]|nr:type II secretion system F family protein [Phycisphaerae bacterium]